MDNKVLQVIAALFIPPLAVYMKNGKIDNAFWINIVLCFLGGLVGITIDLLLELAVRLDAARRGLRHAIDFLAEFTVFVREAVLVLLDPLERFPETIEVLGRCDG